ncbi:class I SAM-dependent methyltransferase [Thermogymnomonas acidicola]|uniref:class I SAM-dependent methyltransferase n=1 Tax=Thermogymnomonas acidicola TaxID=399579 RepID=UPI001669F7E6|nr:class I SAM-dependent methyltransferase [Thermogymnomonas acidicola]
MIPEHGVATLVAGKAIPLVYVREGGSVFIGASRGNEEWFRQVMLSGSALLDLNGKRVRMRATLVSDPDERRVVEGLFRACFPDRFSMWFSERTKWVAMSEGAQGEGGYLPWVRDEFDAIAWDYDRHIYGNWINSYLRERSLGVLSGIVRPGMRVLDIGPGTGTETIPVLEMGAEVTAVDISAGMLTVLRSKAESRGLASRLRCLNGPAGYVLSDLAGKGETFDLVYSTYGALNCEPDLRSVALNIRDCLKEGGMCFISVYNRFCLSEAIASVLRMKVSRVVDRSRRYIPLGHSRFCVDIFSYSLAEVLSCFREHFRVERVFAVPALIPPSDFAASLDGMVDKGRLKKIDAAVSGLPLIRALGDHTAVLMRRL